MKVAKKKKDTVALSELYIALKMLLSADDNRSALVAVQNAKTVLAKYENETKTSDS